jgi:multiple sugar transport system permease protein
MTVAPVQVPPDIAPPVGRGRHERLRTARRLFLAPLTILLGLLTIVPFGYVLVISLTDKASTNPTTGFVGLANYAALFGDPRFWSSITITIIFTVVAVSIELVVGLGVAVALTRITRGTAVIRALILIPMAAAPIATLFNWRVMLNASYGVIDYLFSVFGLPGPDWTGSAATALPTLIVVDTWQWTPFMIIILAGGLASVPQDVYEASAVDGASGWQNFRYITLPMLQPYIAVALLFRSIDALKTFDSVQILTAGGPGTATTTLNYFIFQQGISYLEFGRASAAAVVLLVIATLLARALLRSLKSEATGP